MPFSEATKLEVKRKAAFRCCRCQQVGVDVHHILPENAEGSDDIDNAGPLCQNCHDQLGNNPTKRKEIRQMRDWWYDCCYGRYAQGHGALAAVERLDLILKQTEQSSSALTELRDALRQMTEQVISSITSSNARAAASAIADMAAISSSELDVRTYYLDHSRKALIVCTGDVDIFTSAELRMHLVDAISRVSDRVVLDVSAVDAVDSSGLGVFIGGLRRIVEKGGAFDLVSRNGSHVHKILHITGLNNIFHICESLDEAGVAIPAKVVSRLLGRRPSD